MQRWQQQCKKWGIRGVRLARSAVFRQLSASVSHSHGSQLLDTPRRVERKRWQRCGAAFVSSCEL